MIEFLLWRFNPRIYIYIYVMIYCMISPLTITLCHYVIIYFDCGMKISFILMMLEILCWLIGDMFFFLVMHMHRIKKLDCMFVGCYDDLIGNIIGSIMGNSGDIDVLYGWLTVILWGLWRIPVYGISCFFFNGVMLIKREIYGEMLGHFMGNLSGYCGNGINDVMGFCLDIWYIYIIN